MNARTILVADDDSAVRTVLERVLQRDGHTVRTTGRSQVLWEWVNAGEGDLIITDVVMPDGNGLDLVPRIRERRPDLPILVISAHSTLMTAVKATQSGAYDYLAKPFDIANLSSTVARALEQPSGGHEELEEIGEEALIVGQSPAMQNIFRAIGRLAPTDLTVMIEGESGSGKELVARALHDFGQRRTGPFVAVNVAAIPRELVESELFGHERGAFTGAHQRRDGRFAQAQGGTLFLDEIGDMPPDAQTRLLRVLQEGVFTPLGSRQAIRTDTRIIAATHRDLGAAIQQGHFREDLFYRLNVVPVRVPPLRERRQDIALLARHFLQTSVQSGLPSRNFSHEAMTVMEGHDWPGNVRELENLVRRLVALCANETIDAEDVEAELAHVTPGRQSSGETLTQSIETHLRSYFDQHSDVLPASGLYDRMLHELERPLLALTLDATGGNQVRAADVLGINRNTLRKKLRELGIPAIRGQGAAR
ncbi:MAG: nitrogen regulation protein NR(I) [Alphaproteobacteria bacterium]|jgi:two-component system nitrogen regulation response regulator GlnG